MLTSFALAPVGAHWGGPFGGVGFLWLLVPLFWFVVLFLVFGVFGRRWRRNAGWGGPGVGHQWQAGRTAEASLAERFAQGDIEEKEYRARLEVLRANAFPQPPAR